MWQSQLHHGRRVSLLAGDSWHFGKSRHVVRRYDDQFGQAFLSAIMRSRFSRVPSASESDPLRVIQGRSSRSVIPSSCHTRSPTNA